MCCNMYDITQMWLTIWVIMVFREHLFNIYHVNVLIICSLSLWCVYIHCSGECMNK